MKIKIYKEGMVAKRYEQCIQDGYFPATIQQIQQLINDKKIEDWWYWTSIVTFKGEKRVGTREELSNIKEFYNNGGRAWVAYSIDGDSYAYGINYLYDGNGRLVGVVPEAHKHIFKCECGKVK